MSVNHLKIFFFGAPFFSREILRLLLENNIPIDTVITHPDQPMGRKQIPTPTATKLLSRQRQLKIKEFAELNFESLDFFRKEKPDLFIVASYGTIIPENILTTARLGALNVHPSLLPKLRGATPIQTALLQGLNKTGSTIMLMDAGMDTGNIICQEEIDIDPTEKYPELERRLINLSSALLLPVVQEIIEKGKSPRGIVQNNKEATYTKLIKKRDGLIDWHKSAQEIYNQWRAFYLWPQIYTFYRGQKLTLTEIEIFSQNDIMEKSEPKSPGAVFKKDDNILIATAKGFLKINKLQLAGKKELSIKDFLNGQNKFIGAILN
jgi:methionyl-tRNA formyltransferase